MLIDGGGGGIRRSMSRKCNKGNGHLDAGPAAAISITTPIPLRRPRARPPTLAFAPEALSALPPMALLPTVLVAFAERQLAHRRQVSTASPPPAPVTHDHLLCAAP